MRVVHSLKILVWAEEHQSVIVSDVGLQALEALDAIMQSCIRRIKLESLVRADEGCLPPAVVRIVVNLEHVVGGEATEGVLMISCGLGLHFLLRVELEILFLNTTNMSVCLS